MDDFEELKRRKEKLELEHDIARLERKAGFAKATAEWRWAWVGTLGILGVISLMTSVAKFDQSPNDWGMFLIIGLLLVAPAYAKIRNKR